MWNQDSDSGSEGGDDAEQKFLPSYVVVAIDCHVCMFLPDQDGVLPFRHCLQACFELADALILEPRWSPFAVVLARQEVDFINFTDSIVSTRQLLESKLLLSDEALKAEFLRDHKLEYANFFLKCKKIFHDVTSGYFRRILQFVTNDPDPVLDKTEKYQSVTEVKTFPASDIRFELVTMREDFDYDLFYKEVFKALGVELVEEICLDSEGLMDKFSKLVDPKMKQQKMQFYPFKGDTERIIHLISFSPVRGPPPILLNKKISRDGKKLKLCTEMDENYAEPKFHLKTTKPHTARELVFSAEDRDSLFDLSLKLGLHLMYVSTRTTKVGVVLGNTKLLQEDTFRPSEYFKKFWQCCAESDRVLVCQLKSKCVDEHRYVELIPLLVDGKPTFLMQRIPFCTEINLPERREFPEQEAKPEQIELVEELVNKLTISYDPEMFPDSFQRRKLAYVKAKLLGSESMEDDGVVSFDKSSVDEVLGDDMFERYFKLFVQYREDKRKESFPGSQSKRGRGSRSKMNEFFD